VVKYSEKLKKHRKIIENFSYLSIFQLLNLLIPLIVFPYLIRVLGGEKYGLIIYAQAVIGYFVILINFGFNITATKEVSIHKKNKKKLNKIISSVMIIKGILLLISFTIITLLVFLIPSLWEEKTLFYLTVWMCLYEFIFPIYYFQGIEEMKYITIITLISRLIFLCLIFLLIEDKSDYLLVPIINGTGAIIAGIISQIIIAKKGIKYFWQPLYVLKFYFIKSYVMALAYSSNALKSNLNIVLVKALFSYKEVAYFDLALKVSRVGTSFLELISVSVFPKMSREKNIFFLRKIIYLSLTLSVLYVLFVEVSAPLIISLIGGDEMLDSVPLLRVIVLFVPFQILGGLLGRNSLIVNGYNKDVLYSMAISSFIYAITVLVLYLFLDHLSLELLGAVFVFSFAFDTGYRYIKCRFYKIL
jgi:PST family polysaccharide transporter